MSAGHSRSVAAVGSLEPARMISTASGVSQAAPATASRGRPAAADSARLVAVSGSRWAAGWVAKARTVRPRQTYEGAMRLPVPSRATRAGRARGQRGKLVRPVPDAVQPAVEITGEIGGLLSRRCQCRAAPFTDLSAGDDLGAELLEPGGDAGISGGGRRDDDQRVCP